MSEDLSRQNLLCFIRASVELQPSQTAEQPCWMCGKSTSAKDVLGMHICSDCYEKTFEPR